MAYTLTFRSISDVSGDDTRTYIVVEESNNSYSLVTHEECNKTQRTLRPVIFETQNLAEIYGRYLTAKAEENNRECIFTYSIDKVTTVHYVDSSVSEWIGEKTMFGDYKKHGEKMDRKMIN
jgi:hypothetical protein